MKLSFPGKKLCLSREVVLKTLEAFENNETMILHLIENVESLIEQLWYKLLISVVSSMQKKCIS